MQIMQVKIQIAYNKKMPTASQLPRPSIEGTEKVDNTAYI